jgi:hypothetical protein
VVDRRIGIQAQGRLGRLTVLSYPAARVGDDARSSCVRC